MNDSIMERSIKTFYQTFIATFLTGLMFADGFTLSTLKSITISCIAGAISATMNAYFRYLDTKEMKKYDKNVLESSVNKDNQNSVRDSFRNDWDNFTR